MACVVCMDQTMHEYAAPSLFGPEEFQEALPEALEISHR